MAHPGSNELASGARLPGTDNLRRSFRAEREWTAQPAVRKLWSIAQTVRAAGLECPIDGAAAFRFDRPLMAG